MTESEDLLSQISNDLGLPDFMEDNFFANDLLPPHSLGEDVHNPDISLFSELMQDDGKSYKRMHLAPIKYIKYIIKCPFLVVSFTDSSSLKSEPLSPSSPSSSSCSSTNHQMPPSPSNSDHSEKDLSMNKFLTQTSNAPKIVGQFSPLKNNANLILSPPNSPPENCITTSASNWQPVIQVVSTSGNFVSNHNQAPTIMTMTGLSNVKLPIPKVQRPGMYKR